MTVFNEGDPPHGPAGESDRSGPDERSAASTTIYVCSSCRDASGSDERPRPGELFGDRVASANTQETLEVVQVECLGNCKRRLSAAFARPDGWTYVFGDLSMDDADALIEGASLYRDSANGLIPWRGRPECLKRGLVARIPPQLPQRRQKP